MNSRTIISGISWNYFGILVKAGLQLGVTSVLARLLTPHDYGLVAIGLIVIRFGQYFADMGMAGAIIQKKDIMNEDVGASFILSVAFGIVFFLLFFLGAPLISSFFKGEGLASVIRMMSFGFLFLGVNVTSQGLLKRGFDFKYLSILEITSYVVGYGFVGILMAYYGYGVYSLVGAYLSQIMLMTALCFMKQRYSIAFSRDINVYKKLFTYGKDYSVSNFLSFIASNLDQIIIGRFLPSAAVGLYNRGKYIVSMPTYNILSSLTKVLFPSYSQHQDDNEMLRSLYSNSMLAMGLILLPVCIGMIPAGSQIVTILLGSKWTGSIIILQICCLFVPIDLMTSIAATLCSAKNELKTQIVIQTGIIIFLIVLMIPFSKSGNLTYVCIIMAVVYWCRFILYMLVVKNMLGFSWKELSKIHLPHIGASLVVFASVSVVTLALQGFHTALILMTQIIAGGISLIAYIVVCPHQEVKKIIGDTLMGHRESLERFAITRLLLKRMNGCL